LNLIRGGMNLNSALKTFLGLIALLVGFWAMVDPSWFGQNSWLYGLGWWIYTWDIIKGSVGPMLIFLGIIVIWITYEEGKT
jgi:hypothetical protein